MRGGVEPAHGLDHVAHELYARRLEIAGGKDIENASADRERAVLFNRILPGEAGVDEEVGQVERLDLGAGLDRERRAQQASRGAHPRQEGRRGRDDEPGRAAGRRVQGSRTGGGNAEVRAHAAVRIHLQGRERQDRALHVRVGRAFKRPVEEPRVANELLHVLVRGHDEHGEPGRSACGGDGRKRFGRRRQPGCHGCEVVQCDASRRLAEESPERQRRGGGHLLVHASSPPRPERGWARKPLLSHTKFGTGSAAVADVELRKTWSSRRPLQ